MTEELNKILLLLAQRKHPIVSEWYYSILGEGGFSKRCYICSKTIISQHYNSLSFDKRIIEAHAINHLKEYGLTSYL